MKLQFSCPIYAVHSATERQKRHLGLNPTGHSPCHCQLKWTPRHEARGTRHQVVRYSLGWRIIITQWSTTLCGHKENKTSRGALQMKRNGIKSQLRHKHWNELIPWGVGRDISKEGTKHFNNLTIIGIKLSMLRLNLILLTRSNRLRQMLTYRL